MLKKLIIFLAVNNNQPQLYEGVTDEIRFGKNIKTWQDYELDHGRIETRTCRVITDLQFIENDNYWKNLRTVIRIESIREFRNSTMLTESATRYYISSLQAEPDIFKKRSALIGASRINSIGHWV